MHRIERAAGPFGHPAFGVVAYVGAMWLWHVPALYDAALEHPAVHTLEHVSFAAAGLLYWWHLLSPIRSRLRLGGMGPILYMASTKILVGFLGVLLAFAPDLLYSFYETGGERWGLSAIDDQQVAGLVMALEQSLVMGIALAYLFVRMLVRVRRRGPARRALRSGVAPTRPAGGGPARARPASSGCAPRAGRAPPSITAAAPRPIASRTVMPSPARCRSRPTPSASSVLSTIRPSRASVGPSRP